MRQPLGANPVSCAAFLPYPENIVDAAFEVHDDMLCVPRQLASVLAITLDEAISYFDEFLASGWQATGVTPLQLKEMCMRQGRSFYFLSGQRMLDIYEPPAQTRRQRSVALTSWQGHSYIYNDAKSICARHIASNRGQTPARLANESHHDLPPICEWKQWDGTASPGYHYAKDLADVRSQLLLSGRSPRVVLRNAASADMVALKYTCIKSIDGESGACNIRELPPERDEIEVFLERLPVDIPYCGEGVPGITARALFALLRADRIQPNAAQRAQILAIQRNACNLCGSTFEGDLEWDHIAPLQTLCKGNDQCFQALCSVCHLEKRHRRENSPGQSPVE